MRIPKERQLTFGPMNHDLDNNVNFSPDSRRLVFDTRNSGGINTNRTLGVIHLDTGRLDYFFTQEKGITGVGAASFLNDREVIAIHALLNGTQYDFTRRAGRILPLDGGPGRWLDSRNMTFPFVAGALRGGTHKHEPDHSGGWVGFTYNDHIMKYQNNSDLRNIGVSKRGQPVEVHPDATGENFTGESYSVLLSACVDHPKPGTDEIMKADGDCWIGRDGYPVHLGDHQRSRAFRGAVIPNDSSNSDGCTEVFVVDIPDNITLAGASGPIKGTKSSYPKPPHGVKSHRLTHTARNSDHHLRGVSSHLRSSGDGHWIAFMMNVLHNRTYELQIFCVSPSSKEVRQLSHRTNGFVGDLRFSSDSSVVVATNRLGEVFGIDATHDKWGTVKLIGPAGATVSNIDISPNSHLVAYNRVVDGFKQVFLAEL